MAPLLSPLQDTFVTVWPTIICVFWVIVLVILVAQLFASVTFNV